MADLLIPNALQKQLDHVLKSPPHALLITGVAGSGKRAIAEYLAAKLLQINQDRLNEYPYITVIEKPGGKQGIPIESVRAAIKKLGLKAVINSGNPVNQVVLIDSAHLASTEAQNALLKAIEEPPAATVFILTAISENAVLPTIASRTQKLKIGVAGMEDTLEYFRNEYGDKEIVSAWQLSGGAASLMTALLKDDADHPLKQSVEQAKRIISQKPYERALLLDELSGRKDEFAQVLDALGRILAALHRASITNGSTNSAKLLKARKQVDKAISSLRVNTSPKLIALDLALSLSL